MGMLTVHLRIRPENEIASSYNEKVKEFIINQFEEEQSEYESIVVRTVDPEEFDEIWQLQETYKKQSKEKFLPIVQAGRLTSIEIDI